MSEPIFYRERQQFRQWWLWLIMLGVNALTVFGAIKQVILGEKFGDRPASNTVLLCSVATTLIITIFLACIRLETVIRSNGIYVRFFPFHLSFQSYKWSNLSKIFVRQYNPVGEYGGWGIRLGLFGRGRAFNIAGDKGLQLEFYDNKKLLIGTRQPEELRQVLQKIGQYKV